MRGCMAPAVLEMAFLWSERLAKAMWWPGTGDRPVTHPAANHRAHCSSSRTTSVNCSSQTAVFQYPQLPYVLAQGSWQTPRSSAGLSLGIPPPLPSQGAVPFPWPGTMGSTVPQLLSSHEPLGGGMGGLCVLFTAILILLDDMGFCLSCPFPASSAS